MHKLGVGNRLSAIACLVLVFTLSVPSGIGAASLSPAGNSPAAVAESNVFSCGGCHQWGEAHYFPGYGCGDEDVTDPCFDCSAFNSCHSNFQTGSCADWHQYCGRGGEAQAALEVALKKNDVREVRELFTEYPGTLTYNRARTAVQVHNCRGEVVGHFSLSKEIANALDTSLVQVSSGAVVSR
jgi:hypothetical protein